MATTSTRISDAEKQAVWDAYYARRPVRTPVLLATNSRVVHASPEWNPEGYTFEQAFHDPAIHLQIELRHALYRRRVLGLYSDSPSELPGTWEVGVFLHNVYEAAPFGGAIQFLDGQTPTSEPPAFADDDRKAALFDVDIEHPLDSPYWQGRLSLWRDMQRIAKDMKFEGRPVRVAPLMAMGTDGPVTAGCNLRGAAFLMDLLCEPEYAQRVMRFAVEAMRHRRRAFAELHGDKLPRATGAGFADDSCAMLGVEQWRELVKPHHQRILDILRTDGANTPGPRCGVHMCGDATHLFPHMARELGVNSFDTGFPVDHRALRDALGPDVEILGGPEIQCLKDAAPEQIFERTKSILQSGVLRGGRFVLREGNNLPPGVPDANLAAMYDAALAFGRYDRQ